jgi:hypothetical protein
MENKVEIKIIRNKEVLVLYVLRNHETGSQM